MADNGIKISGLTAATSVDNADVVPGVQSGTTKKFSFATIKTWVQGWLTKTDVGLGNVDNVQQYSASNKPTPADIGAAADSTVAIVETGDNASQNLTAGQYVIWQGALYTANENISSGTALSGKLTAVSGGAANALLADIDGVNSRLDGIRTHQVIISANGSRTLTFSGLTAGALFFSASSDSSRGLYFVGSSASGAMTHTTIFAAASITITENGKVVTISSSSSAQIALLILMWRGAAPTVT